MQSEIGAINKTGIQVVAISYDSVDVLKKFGTDSKISYQLLSDPESKVINAYGVLNENARGRQEGIPYPGTFLVGQDGKVKAFLPGTTRTRHSPNELIEATKKLK